MVRGFLIPPLVCLIARWEAPTNGGLTALVPVSLTVWIN